MELVRFAYTPMGTFGKLVLPNNKELYTVEKAWRANRKAESCIPEGEYKLRKRDSPVVARTSRGKYPQGWEVVNVPDRTFIMIHVGNTENDLDGCIAPGIDLGFVHNKWAVVQSAVAMDELMTALTKAEYDLTIKQIDAAKLWSW